MPLVNNLNTYLSGLHSKNASTESRPSQTTITSPDGFQGQAVVTLQHLNLTSRGGMFFFVFPLHREPQPSSKPATTDRFIFQLAKPPHSSYMSQLRQLALAIASSEAGQQCCGPRASRHRRSVQEGCWGSLGWETQGWPLTALGRQILSSRHTHISHHQNEMWCCREDGTETRECTEELCDHTTKALKLPEIFTLYGQE